ncbi:MAG: hypothetical protein R3F35_10825 [Myxococcota bacterium]
MRPRPIRSGFRRVGLARALATAVAAALGLVPLAPALAPQRARAAASASNSPSRSSASSASNSPSRSSASSASNSPSRSSTSSASNSPSRSSTSSAPNSPSPSKATLRLEPDAIERSGIDTIVVAGSRFEPTVRGFGRVLDPALIVDAVANVEALRAAEASARAEQARVETLARDDQNASRREVESARTLAARARADVAMAHTRLVAQIGPELARDPDLAALTRRLEDGRASLIRIDVPGSEAPPAPERGVRFTTYPARQEPLEARYVGFAATVDPTLPGFALLFLATTNPPRPGTPVIADCRTAAPPEIGVALPPSAVVYLAGRPFAWVEPVRGRFERRALETISRDDGSLFVRQGLVPGERVVSAGAQQLLSSELLGDDAGGAE